MLNNGQISFLLPVTDLKSIPKKMSGHPEAKGRVWPLYSVQLIVVYLTTLFINLRLHSVE
jgi:hypothetical protein